MSFFNTKLDQQYDQWRKDAFLKQVTVLSLLTGTLYIFLSIFDSYFAPHGIILELINYHRFLGPSFLYLIAFLAFYTKSDKAIRLILIFTILLAITFHTYALTQLTYYTPFHIDIYLIIFWTFSVSGLRLKDSTLTAVLSIIISFIGLSYTSYTNMVDPFMHHFWIFTTFSFGFAGAYLLETSSKTVFLQQQKLSQELNNKNILLKELSHRVKNNLQIVASILYSQSQKINDEKITQIFDDSIQTIKSMGILHEKLHKSQNLDSIDFKDYIQSLISLSQQNIYNQKVHFSFEAQSIIVGIENSIPLGLIVNEVITNSLKYAHPNHKKDLIIKIQISISPDKELKLHISDNGVGINFDKYNKGFGTQLINSLVTYQLKGEINSYNNNGLNYEIKFMDKRTSTFLIN